MRQFDSLDAAAGYRGWQKAGSGANQRAYLPCPKGKWCHRFSDRFAAALINHQARHLYYEEGGRFGLGPEGSERLVGGLVLSPQVGLRCVYPEDGNSMAEEKICTPLGGDGEHCIPGCYPRGRWCTATRQWTCSYPPSQLKEALEVQQGHPTFRTRNNEFIVDASSYTAQLPGAVLAFFGTPASGSDEWDQARAARAAFMAQYGLTEANGPPLLTLDLKWSAATPFRLKHECHEKKCRGKMCDEYSLPLCSVLDWTT